MQRVDCELSTNRGDTPHCARSRERGAAIYCSVAGGIAAAAQPPSEPKSCVYVAPPWPPASEAGTRGETPMPVAR